MLRELNLYPAWTRRQVPKSAQETVQEIASPVISIQQVHAPGPERVTVAEHISVPLQADAQILAPVQEDVTAGLSLFELAERPAGVSAEDSLREFQMKIAGGPLAEMAWPELEEKVKGCELCALRAGCTQTVFGTGDLHADWLFVGEAPGEQEDATGEPFVGPAGLLLNNMLLAIRLKRSEVYITNVIKCRPPEDRHPHVGEVAACQPYLKRQIALVKPRVIVALGKTAVSALLESDATIASLRGTVHDYKGIPLIVTYHPAYLLRSPMEKGKAWQDLCLAVKTMRAVEGS